MTARIVRDDDAGLAEAVEVLRSGGIVALPTDTVYGIAVALDTPGGVEALFSAKRRPPDKGIMLLLADAEQASTIGQWPPSAAALASAFWPGGLTVIVPQRPDVPLPAALTGGTATIGLRVPDHSTPRAIAAAVGPLPTTSANVSGVPDARDAAEIVDQVGDAIDLVLDGGPADGGPPSTVVDCTVEPPRILRAGAIPIAAIEAVLGRAIDPPACGARRRRDRRARPRSIGRAVVARRGKIAAPHPGARRPTVRAAPCGERDPGPARAQTEEARGWRSSSRPARDRRSPTSTPNCGRRWKPSATASTTRSS